MYANLVATGCYVPEREITNAEIDARLRPIAPTFVTKIAPKSGIERRFYAPDGWATSDLAARAAEDCLRRAGVDASELDLVVVGTDSPDYITPSTSVVVQHKIGAKRAGTFDVGCACASFPTAVATAVGMLHTNAWMKKVLVIGAYMMRKLADPMDPMIFFYGDGAGAALIERSEEPGVITSAFRADGAYAKDWCIASSGTAEPPTEQSVREGRTKVRMLEKYPPEINDEGWPAVVRMLAERGGFEVGDIDVAIFTQVRKVQIEQVAASLGLPIERCPMIMGKWGYTGSACIPMALHDAAQRGAIRAGSLVVLVGSGVGYNQAGVAFRAGARLAAQAAGPSAERASR